MTTENFQISVVNLNKACSFISNDLNIYLTIQQMDSLISSNQDLVDSINSFGMTDDDVQVELHNHFCHSLIGKSSPCQPDEDWSELPDGVIESFMVNLQNAACDKGYRYSTHPDGPEAELV